MGDELANANRSYSLAATCIAIFTFTMIFLYPRFASGEVNAVLFQATLAVMGVATFAFVFSSLYYYQCSIGRLHDVERTLYSRRRSVLVGRLLSPVSGSELGPLRGRAFRYWIFLVRALAGVSALRDPLLPEGPRVRRWTSAAKRAEVIVQT
jgi:hypothetical protein